MNGHYDDRPHPNLADLYHKMGVVEGKIDAFLERATRLDRELTEMDERVSSLEQLKWKVFGAALTMSGLLSLAISIYEGGGHK